MNGAWSGLLGGVLIGTSAALLLLFNGRIAGISGIVDGLVPRAAAGDAAWRVAFIAGLVGAGGIAMRLLGQDTPSPVAVPALLVAGLLVGFGTRLGNGCTSGHGVCGLGRRSARSFVAVVVFMLAAMATVFVARHVMGGVA